MPNALQPALDEIDADSVVNVQYSWRGRRYCWYVNGWRGPGWYRCGFHLRRGFGWGGPMGWHGWESGRGDFRRDRGFRRSEGMEFRRGETREMRRGEGQWRGDMRDRRAPAGSQEFGRGGTRSGGGAAVPSTGAGVPSTSTTGASPGNSGGSGGAVAPAVRSRTGGGDAGSGAGTSGPTGGAVQGIGR